MAGDLTPYLNPGVDVSKMDPAFVESLTRMFSAAPPEIAGKLRIGSGYRDEATQAKLFADAVAKYGSPDAARKWVAPPGQSKHNTGTAVDLSYGDDTAKAWAQANAATHGLHFPMSWEPWHVEPIGAPPAPGPRWMPSGAAAAGAPLVPAGVVQPAPQGAPAPAPAGVVQPAGRPPMGGAQFQQLVAALGGRPAMPAQQAFAPDPMSDALMSFGADMKARKAKEEADRKARLRAMMV